MLCVVRRVVVLHTDNNILVDRYNPVRIFHIVPEWYLLHVYMLIKRVPSAALGMALVLLAIIILCSSTTTLRAGIILCCT